ncbi:hypothetical protein BHM03_00022768 [Ensete ventricosum]|nr:hypothetical protein BHM03_00022768 [Ensete ventricosum]
MIAKNCYDPSEIEASRQLKVKAIGSKDEKKGNPPTVPKYVNLEPSLAMDWLEISWDELELKERIGAGTSFSEKLVMEVNYFIIVLFQIDLNESS